MSSPHSDDTHQPDAVETPWSSRLLRLDDQLTNTATLLTTMRAMLDERLPASKRLPLQALIASTETRHNDLRVQVGTLLQKADFVISKDFLRPNRVSRPNAARDVVEEQLCDLESAVGELQVKADEFEKLRQEITWGIEDSEGVA